MENCFARIFPPLFHFSIAGLDCILLIYYRGSLPSCPDQIRGWIYGQFIIHFWGGIVSANKSFRSLPRPDRLGESIFFVFSFIWLFYAMIIGYKTIECVETYPVLYFTMAVGALIIGVKSSRKCKEQTTRQHQPLLSVAVVPAPVLFNEVESGALNETCSFCMEEFAGDDSVVKLRCNHIYHSRVIRAWLSTTQSCPLCRKPVEVR